MSSHNDYTEEEEEEAYYRFIQAKLEQEERAKREAAEEEAYYRYVQEKRDQEERAKREAAAPAPSPREKYMSLGVSSHAVPAPRDAERAKLMEKNEKFAKYRAQMENDQRRVIEETRKPFVRKNYDDEPVEKFAIGKYTDAESSRRDKREAQQSYLRQLQADQMRKPVEEVERKSTMNSARSNPPTYRSNDGGGGLNIGRDEEYEKIAKRRAAIEVQIRNNEAIQAKLMMEGSSVGSPGKTKKNEPLYDLNRGNDQRAFENADYRYIGEREGDERSRRQQNANAYMHQLNEGMYI